MSPNICFSRLARSTFCQRPIRFPPERCAFSPLETPCGIPCVLETFQNYAFAATAVNPLTAQDFHLFSTVRGVSIQELRLGDPENSFLQRARKRASTWARHKIRHQPKRKTIHKLKIAWRLCYSRKPFREPCPRMRTPERGQLEAYELDAQAAARIQQASSDTPVTCPRSIFYTKLPGIAQEENQKSYLQRIREILGVARATGDCPPRAPQPGGDARRSIDQTRVDSGL